MRSGLNLCVIEILIAFLVAGVGLNVDNKKPTTCLNGFLRELSIVAYQFKREDILAAFFDKFEQFYNLFVDQGKFSLCQFHHQISDSFY